MERVDCLFLHVPKVIHSQRPAGQVFWISFLPMGLLALADLLQRHTISSEIVHLGVEWMEDHAFSILDYIRERNPRIVAASLHWHRQSFEVMEVVKKIKAAFPQIYILLGGFTASFFHEEIMKNFDVVDGVIRGEAEKPLLELAQALLQGKDDLFSIPNLTWRRKKRVLVNPLSYVAEEKDLNSLHFTHFPLLKNYPTYIRYAGQPFYLKRFPKEKHLRRPSAMSPVYHLAVGRGCPVQCTWCSGNIPSENTITGRRKVTFRGVEEVLQTIREAIPYGYQTIHIAFDPSPQNPAYFLKLFDRIRQERLQIDCIFESFGLPTPQFIRSFKETFPGSKSLITLSPDVGSDRVRRIHKGYAYTNLALRECLDQMKDHRVFCDLFFTLGVPFEKEENLQQTVRLHKEIQKKYSNVRGIHTSHLDMEPGSPWQVDPESFGVKTSLRDFMDYYRFHSGENRHVSSLGYWIPNYFPGVEDERGFEERLQKLRSLHPGFIHPDSPKLPIPFWEKRLGDLSSLVQKAKGLRSPKTRSRDH